MRVNPPEPSQFSGPATLEWEDQVEAESYNLYRDLHSSLIGLGFGQCNQQGIPNNSFTDGDPIPTGDVFFYLVTAVNPLGEESGKGLQGDGSVRAGNTCP